MSRGAKDIKAYVDEVQDFIALHRIRDSITLNQLIFGGWVGPTQEQWDANKRLWEYYDGILIRGMYERYGKAILWGQPNPDNVVLKVSLWMQAEARHKDDAAVERKTMQDELRDYKALTWGTM